ncbi:MAG: D-hexose-6-phosphate mutarotase [Bacteroidota bacterium]
MITIETLNEKFGIAGKVQFYKGKGDLVTASVNTGGSTADICLYGAQALSFIPAGTSDLLWMSERSLFEEGKAIRGGIPVCFPWFGPHSTDKTKPQHGFARLQYWDVTAVKENADKSIAIELSLQQSEASLQMWPFNFNAKAIFIVGKSLQLQLTVTNTGNEPFEYSDALHTYFNISNIDTVVVEGLQDATYYEAFGTALKTQQNQLLYFNEETNRRYVNTTSNCIIHDKNMSRKISVEKTGSKVTVVWNPAEATTKTIADITPDGYKTFVCVEPANAYPGIDMITLSPGQSHTLSTTIKIED